MPDYTALDAALSAASIPFKTEEPMRLHTTFKIGGAADRYIEISTSAALQTVLGALSRAEIP